MSWMIKIEDVSKMYRLGLVSSATLQDDFKRAWYKFRGKEDPFLKIGEENKRDSSGGEYVWALKDINFEVEKGEVLGIIGKNGAGKSTLLKLLSKVTKPTTGCIKTKGRIASLLEVGTGFHPELTGRENIFLNGAILGMKKSEIKSKFDEIVDFSGCERYIDTPVKRYSSGMYVRLAFAVAAHLEPEILVVDEVLAVGDAEFQKKAIGKMKDVSQGQGRTVLFVSHNMGSIKSLCSKTILMKNGTITKYGETDEVINTYLNDSSSNSAVPLNERDDRKGSGKLIADGIKLYNSNNIQTSEFIPGERMKLIFKLNGNLENGKFLFNVIFTNNFGSAVAMFRSDEINPSLELNTEKTISIEIPELNLRPEHYNVSYYLANNSFSPENFYDSLENCISFEVLNYDYFKTGKMIKNGNFGLINATLHS